MRVGDVDGQDVTGLRAERREARRRTRSAALVVALGLLGSSALIWQSSRATFTATTSNGTNSWSTGTVSLNNDGGATAMFTATGLTPSSTGSHCITVTYGGSVGAPVKLYGSSYLQTNGLGSYVDLVIEEGTGGSFSSCAGFSASGTIYNGTLNGFSALTSYASGVGTWTPTSNGQTKVYRFTYTLNAAAPNSVQNSTTSISFVWEADA